MPYLLTGDSDKTTRFDVMRMNHHELCESAQFGVAPAHGLVRYHVDRDLFQSRCFQEPRTSDQGYIE